MGDVEIKTVPCESFCTKHLVCTGSSIPFRMFAFRLRLWLLALAHCGD